jgi:GT2 family glycosyltransferase
MTALPRVTAVILAYGAEPFLDTAVRAVLASTGVTIDVVLVDNGCTTDAVDQIKGISGVRVIRPEHNTGYTGGCHLGAAEATGDYLAFVNSDAIVAESALRHLVDVAAEPGVGLAMGSIRLADQPDLINTAGNPLHYSGLSWAGGYQEPASRYGQRRTVACGSGCCFVMTRQRWTDFGGFPLEYFAYCEDSELSLRLWQRGYTVEYVPDAIVLHHYEFSRNPTKSYLLERNRLVLLLTTYQLRSLLVLAPMLLVTEAAMVGAAVFGGWGGAKLRGWGWIWQHRGWIRARRRELQTTRTVPDRALASQLTGRFAPSNLEAPPGLGVYNMIGEGYWRLARRLL